MGSIGDSSDDALGGTVNDYSKAELKCGPARSEPWTTVELANLTWRSLTTPAPTRLPRRHSAHNSELTNTDRIQ